MEDWDREKVRLFYEQIFFLQMEEDQVRDLRKLNQKQLYLRQLMMLKTKGRFLDETKTFEDHLKCLPSSDSQARVVNPKPL